MALGRTARAIHGALRTGAFAVVQRHAGTFRWLDLTKRNLGTPPIKSFIYLCIIYLSACFLP